MLGITESGRLDRVTREKISTFKSEHDITSDETVDFQTFEAIKNTYLQKMIVGDNVSYAPYDYEEKFRAISDMLRLIISYYSLPVRLPRGAVYGYDAIRAVRYIRTMYCLRESDTVDGELISYLQRDIRSINAIKKQADAR
jgi:hypothetical protein